MFSKTFLTIVGFGALVLVAMPFLSEVRANEGEFRLRNVTGQSARCAAYSVLMQNQEFSVLMSCRDIVYPAGTDVFNYIVWAEAPDGDLERLGALGFGKVEFETNEPFNALFVTQEKSARPRSPEGPVQMRGNIERIEFLYGESSSQGDTGNNLNQVEAEPTEAPAENEGGSSISRIIATGGIVGFVLLFLVVALLFVVTRR